MGHIARHCPARQEEYKRKNKRYHAHAVDDEEPPPKMLISKIKDEEPPTIIKDVLISALSGSVTPGEDTSLIDSGASKHMTGQRDTLLHFRKEVFSESYTWR